MSDTNTNRKPWNQLSEQEQLQRQMGTFSAMPPKSPNAKYFASGPAHDPLSGIYNAHLFLAPSPTHEVVKVRQFAKGGAPSGEVEFPSELVGELHRGHFESRMYQGRKMELFVSDGVIGRLKCRISDNAAVTYTATVKIDREYEGFIPTPSPKQMSVWLNQTSSEGTPWSLSFKPSGVAVDPTGSDYSDL